MVNHHIVVNLKGTVKLKLICNKIQMQINLVQESTFS